MFSAVIGVRNWFWFHAAVNGNLVNSYIRYDIDHLVIHRKGCGTMEIIMSLKYLHYW